MNTNGQRLSTVERFGEAVDNEEKFCGTHPRAFDTCG
jgi:hypothetical protein